ncbi:MAG: secretin N-terminal domain-containing protein [Candidatus Aminicenantes bacterium]|nr:secretin N-terminal domain-containing protein [Candidatus Aminicenantes bacterium]
MRRALLLILFSFLLIQCGGKQPEVVPTPVKKKEAVESKEKKAVPSPVKIPSQDVVKTVIKKGKTQKLTIELEGGDVRQVLMAIMTATKYSIVMDPEVKGTVPRMSLKDITLDQALYYILTPLGYDYSWEGDVLHVYKPRFVTRIFTVNFLPAERKGTRKVSYSSVSTITGGMGGMMGGVGGVSGIGGIGGVGGAGAGLGGMGAAGLGMGLNASTSNIDTKTDTNLWSDLSMGLSTLLFNKVSTKIEKEPRAISVSDNEGRKLIISPQSGIIFVRAEEEKINQVASFIESIQGSAQRQVWMEVKIVEVKLNAAHQLGVNWESVLKTAGFFGTLPSTSTLLYPAVSFDSGKVSSQELTGENKGLFTFSVSNKKLDLLIDALRTQGKVEVLSSPRISALQGEKALIRVIREQPFFTMQTQISQSYGSQVVAPSIMVQVVPVGVVLDIIPSIGTDGNVIFSINVDVSELVKVEEFASENSRASQPVIDRRSIDTVIKAKQDQTVIIAGIIKRRKDIVEHGVPFFMNLPGIGSLFRRKEVLWSTSELAIFITPVIVSGKRVEELTQQERERLQKILKELPPDRSSTGLIK